MEKKHTIPTAEALREAYEKEYPQRRYDAEDFANFTETELAEYIRTYADAASWASTVSWIITTMTRCASRYIQKDYGQALVRNRDFNKKDATK